jgi:solute carrier family 25 S-adenosylmethionine transporter 26
MVSAASNAQQNATLQTLSKFRSNPLALWRGYAALAGRNLPFTAMQFPMFERLKVAIKESRDRRGKTRGGIVESGIITAVSAGSAGSVAAVITTPIDVVKTRIMLAAVEDSSPSQASSSASSSLSKQVKGKEGLVDAFGKSTTSPRNALKASAKNLVSGEKKGRKSSWQIGQEIVQEKGAKGLWRGGALRGGWTFIGAGLYLGAYESGRVYLAARRGEKVDEGELL